MTTPKSRPKKSSPITDRFCSFCGKHQKDVRHLVAGPYACICDECIRAADELFAEQFKGERFALAAAADARLVSLQELGQRLGQLAHGVKQACESAEQMLAFIEAASAPASKPAPTTETSSASEVAP